MSLESKSEYVSSRRQFHKYKNKVLVETGTYLGEGIQDALNAGFSQVISIEVEPGLARNAQIKFKDNSKVKIIQGGSSQVLFDAIKEIGETITFWLDGHYSGPGTGTEVETTCPLFQELEQIDKHPIKAHTIMIDDRRLFKDKPEGIFPMTEAEVIERLKKINPKYQFKYEDGYVKDDILVAYL